MNENKEQFIEYWEGLCLELYPYMARKTSWDDADDLLQDIGELAYEKFTLFHKKGYNDFKRWVYGVAAKKIKKWHYKRRKLSLLNAEYSDNIVEMSSLVDEILLEERKEELKSSLEQLTPAERRLVGLRNYQDLSYKQIAKITGKSEASLMTQYSRIIKKLYLLLQPPENLE